MDPASVVLGVVSGAAALTAMAVKTTTYLVGIKDSFDQANLVILDLIAAIKAFSISWERIHDWAAEQTTRAQESKNVFEQLLDCLEFNKVILDGLQKDVKRFSTNTSSVWPRRSRAATVLHKGLLRDHCERLHRQVSLLHILLATAKLPSSGMQQLIIESLQPAFRKDEESAWTIVQTRQSTRRAASSIFHGSSASSFVSRANGPSLLSRPNSGLVQSHLPSQRFDFENDLILAPVYKRVLFRSLSSPDTIKEESSLSRKSGKSSKSVPGDRIPPAVQVERTRLGGSLAVQNRSTTIEDDVFVGSITSALRNSGNVSVGVQADLEELRQFTPALDSPIRSLPLASVLRQSQMTPAEQAAVNCQLIKGAKGKDALLVAKALDSGAQINDVSVCGESALQIALENSYHWESLVPALLILYRDTNVRIRLSHGNTLLHLAVKEDNHLLLNRLLNPGENRLEDIREDLKAHNSLGKTPLHVAVRQGELGFKTLRKINDICRSTNINADDCQDRRGWTPLHVAVQEGDKAQGLELLNLGCNPLFTSQLCTSPLELAVSLGEADFVRLFLPRCDAYIFQKVLRAGLITKMLQSALDRKDHKVLLPLVQFGGHSSVWEKGLNDKLLTCANFGGGTELMLTLFSMDCFPKTELDITPCADAKDTSQDLALGAFQRFKATRPTPNVIYRGCHYENDNYVECFPVGSDPSEGRKLSLCDLLVEIVFANMDSRRLSRLRNRSEEDNDDFAGKGLQGYRCYTLEHTGNTIAARVQAEEILSEVIKLANYDTALEDVKVVCHIPMSRWYKVVRRDPVSGQVIEPTTQTGPPSTDVELPHRSRQDSLKDDVGKLP